MQPTQQHSPTRMMDQWPPLPQTAWSDTCATLQLWMQIVGKVRLALTRPSQPHLERDPLSQRCAGLPRHAHAHGTRMLQIDFDFIDHCPSSKPAMAREGDPLKPMTVARFYERVMRAARSWAVPSASGPSRASRRPHPLRAGSYSPRPMTRSSRSGSGASCCKRRGSSPIFRARFIGKVSPSTSSGARSIWPAHASPAASRPSTPAWPGLPDRVTRDAYSHEVSSCGFWPGAPGIEPFFYSYAYP
jgi:hypothetical protein